MAVNDIVIVVETPVKVIEVGTPGPPGTPGAQGDPGVPGPNAISAVTTVTGLTGVLKVSGGVVAGSADAADVGAEPDLGNPNADGKVLSSSAAGVRSWVTPASGGAIDWASPVVVTGTSTLATGKHHVCTGTTADYTVTLPPVTGNAGKLISVEMAGALTKLVTVDAGAGVAIDGQQTRVMWARETALLLCNGVAWTKVAGKSVPSQFNVYQTADMALTVSSYTKIISLANTLTTGRFRFESASNQIRVLAPLTAWVKPRIGMKNLTPANNIYYAGIFKNNAWWGADGFFAPSFVISITPGNVNLGVFATNDYLDFRGYTDDSGVSSDTGSGNPTATCFIGVEVPTW